MWGPRRIERSHRKLQLMETGHAMALVPSLRLEMMLLAARRTAPIAREPPTRFTSYWDGFTKSIASLPTVSFQPE